MLQQEGDRLPVERHESFAPEPVARRFVELIAADGFTALSISHAHALRAGSFPADHRDPFDRMLAAQAEIEEVPLVTCDPAFKEFGIETLW